MKLGCASWCFAGDVHVDTEYENVISTIADLGFKGLELIAFSEKTLMEYYNPKKIKQLNDLYNSYDLTLSEFVVYHEIIEGLAGLDKQKKKKAIL